MTPEWINWGRASLWTPLAIHHAECSFSLWLHCLAQTCRWISRWILWVFTAQQKLTRHFKPDFGFAFSLPCTDKKGQGDGGLGISSIWVGMILDTIKFICLYRYHLYHQFLWVPDMGHSTKKQEAGMSFCLHSLLQVVPWFGLWSRDQETQEVFRAPWLKKRI